MKDINEKKPKEEQRKIQVVQNNILVDGKLDLPEVSVPKPSQLFLDPKTQEIIDNMQAEMVETEPILIRNSEFIGLAAPANTTEQVVYQRYPCVDHAVMAYSLKENGTLKNGFCDDKEYGAGIRLRKILFDQKCRDTVVFVLRKYGGVHIGFQRFETIEEVAKRVINMLNG